MDYGSSKNAFADLFQSASSGNSTSSLNSKLNNLSLSERQKLQQQQQQQQQQRQQTFQQPTKTIYFNLNPRTIPSIQAGQTLIF